MSLFPEQTRALSYAHRKGTAASADSIRRKLATTFGELETLLESVPENVVAESPGPSRWSLHEIVDHLVLSHRPAAVELTSLVSGRSPDSGPIPAGLVSEDPFSSSWSTVFADLKAVHRDFLQSLADATDDTPLTARAPVVLVVKCKMADGRVEPVEWVESVDWKAYAILFRAHTLEHLRQVQRTLAAVAPAGA